MASLILSFAVDMVDVDVDLELEAESCRCCCRCDSIALGRERLMASRCRRRVDVCSQALM
jgi:hypothetical protein